MRNTIAKAGAGFAGLIALYIVVFNGTKAGSLFKAGADGTVKVTKALQGR
jgi:hypothetical protein